MIRVFKIALALCSLTFLQGCSGPFIIESDSHGVTYTREGLRILAGRLGVPVASIVKTHVSSDPPSQETRRRFGEAMMEFETKYSFVVDPDSDEGRQPSPNRTLATISLILSKNGRPAELLRLEGSNHTIHLFRNPRSCFVMLKDYSAARETPFLRHMADDLAAIIARHAPELPMHWSSRVGASQWSNLAW